MQMHLTSRDPWQPPTSLISIVLIVSKVSGEKRVCIKVSSLNGNVIVWERKWEIDSLASFLGFSYQYWNATGDSSFVQSTEWVDAVEAVLQTIHDQQEPTFDDAGAIEKKVSVSASVC